MSTEIEVIEYKISRLRRDLAEAEKRLEEMMTDSRPPEKDNIAGIKTREDWYRVQARGCWLANYRPGYIAVFEPAHNGGGSYGGIYGALADELGQEYDSWNFGVYQRRGAI